MTQELAKLFKNASPECIQLREDNHRLYREIFRRGATAARKQIRGAEREARQAGKIRGTR